MRPLEIFFLRVWRFEEGRRQGVTPADASVYPVVTEGQVRAVTGQRHRIYTFGG